MLLECVARVIPEILVVFETVVSGRDAEVEIKAVETVELEDVSIRNTQSADITLTSRTSEFHVIFAI